MPEILFMYYFDGKIKLFVYLVWTSRKIPKKWKPGLTVIAYIQTRGTKSVDNFRLITYSPTIYAKHINFMDSRSSKFVFNQKRFHWQKNTFVKVHHQLICDDLKFHHSPPEIVFALLQKMKWFHTYQLKHRCVKVANSLSTLIFNLCFNTLMITAN